MHNTHKEKIERFLARKGVLFGGVLGLNTLCRDCSSHTTLVGLLYPGGDKSEKVCTGYVVQPNYYTKFNMPFQINK